jgi:hypothetical protein
MEGLLRVCADLMPMTWCNDALRDLMLAPGGFAEVAGPVGLLVAFAALCFVIALRVFRWT